jgi:hypothetical protein
MAIAIKNYISDFNRFDEPNDWFVAVILAKTGKEFDLGARNKIRMVDRVFGA